MRTQVWKVLGAGMVLILGPASSQTRPEVEVRTARFHRDGGTTLIDGFCLIPFAVLEPLTMGPDGEGYYTVTVTVRDDAKLVLHQSEWSQVVPVSVLRTAGTSAVEHFSFGANPGRYDIEVAVRDSASGRVQRSSTVVVAYDTRPAASDLLLTALMRTATTVSDTTPAAGELRKGALFLTSATRPVITPREPTLYYYVELYADSAGQASLVATVKKPDGRDVITAPPLTANVAAGENVATSGLNLAGLPPGDYRLDVDVDVEGQTVTKSADFVMAGFETDKAIAELITMRTADVWSNYTEQQLDSLYRPLVYVMENDERGVYEDLSMAGKQNYLRRFWAKRDPTQGTPDNELQAAYYGRIAQANRRFREGGAGETDGWRTDRGRIFLRNGEPEEKFEQPQPAGPYKYEVWKYYRGRGNKYVFIDDSGFGNFVLVYTEDRLEASRAQWETFFDEEDLRRIRNF